MATEKALAGPRNVHQRKLAVMAKCAAIVPDGFHQHHKFKFLSIQMVSNHLRAFCAEEGLDVTPGFDPQYPGYVRIDFVNADDPADAFVAWYPEVPQDKGFAYSTKYPLVRAFLIGDGEEDDEAEMATRSAAASAGRTNGHRAPEQRVVDGNAGGGRPVVTPSAPPAPAAGGQTGQPEAPEDRALLYDLAASLPTPRSSKDVDKIIGSLGYSKALARITQAHLQECGSDCDHLAPKQGSLVDPDLIPAHIR